MMAQNQPNVKTEAANNKNEFSFLDKTQKDIQELRTQQGFINAEVTGIKARIDKVETSIAVVSSQANSWFTGDVGYISIVGAIVLLAIVITSFFQYQIEQLKKKI